MTLLEEIAGALRTVMVAEAASVAAAPRTIDKQLVHKSCDENVLVSHIESVPTAADKPGSTDGGSGRSNHFRGILCVHRGHKFFFEHDGEHVSGLYLIEASRQLSIAVAHLFYKVPFDIEFVMTESFAQFRNVANLEDPLLAELTMSRHAFRKGRLSSMYSEIVVRQRNLEVARLGGTMILLSKHQLRYLEQRARNA